MIWVRFYIEESSSGIGPLPGSKGLRAFSIASSASSAVNTLNADSTKADVATEIVPVDQLAHTCTKS